MMKNKIMYFTYWISSFLFTTKVKASELESSVGIELKEDGIQKVKNILPQTGEYKTYLLIIIGCLVFFLVFLLSSIRGKENVM